jgi:hypothetical protein
MSRGDIVEGSSVLFEAGPFLDADDAVIDLTSWTVKLYYREPDGTTGTHDGSGTADGMMQCTPAAGALTPTGTWKFRLEGVSGAGVKRYGELATLRVVPVAGYAP